MNEEGKTGMKVKWTEEQTKSVLDLYFRLEADRKSYSDNDPEIVDEATKQKRPAASIGYKLMNYRFLDPRCEREGKQGLSGISKRDVESWIKYAGMNLSERAVRIVKEKGWLVLLLDNNGYSFFPSGVVRSLLSKPFLILTGPSGTGKTLGAIQLAESICEAECRALVAVGADWTDNRHVVGFLNPLQTVDGTATGTPIYETTKILNLLLHANAEKNRNKPHVLILDEMNLSHVERYFADFLSAMELEDKKKALKLHSAGMAKTREGVDVPGSIDFPDNLFVIGTVNIDETTYMFSPKVLDRANVIEIHADKTALENFLKGIDGESGPEARDYGISFLDAARAIRNEEEHEKVPPLPNQVRDLAAKHLMEIFKIMQRGRGEFGFRTGREVLAYLRTAHFLTPEADRAAWASPEGGWLKALDAQILQKILPKLHGSRTRLAPLLGALATYCATGTETAAMEHFPKDGNPPTRSLKDAMAADSITFETSYQKLKRMIEVLVEEQFVSFIC